MRRNKGKLDIKRGNFSLFLPVFMSKPHRKFGKNRIGGVFVMNFVKLAKHKISETLLQFELFIFLKPAFYTFAHAKAKKLIDRDIVL
jgi:hypothetical protein